MKKWMIASLLSLGLLIIAGCGSVPLENGGSLDIEKDGLTINSGNDQEGSVNITVNDDGEMTLTGKDESGEKFEQKVSMEQKLPDGMPQDLPIPVDVELKVIESEVKGAMQYIVNYNVKGRVIDAYNQYREYIEQAGYGTISDASEGKAKEDTNSENLLAKSEGITLSIGILKKGTGKYDDGTISVNIMYLTDIE